MTVGPRAVCRGLSWRCNCMSLPRSTRRSYLSKWLLRLAWGRSAVHGHRRAVGAVLLVRLRAASVRCARRAAVLPRLRGTRPGSIRGPFTFRARAGGRQRERGGAECIESGPAEVEPGSVRSRSLRKAPQKRRFAKRTSQFANSHMPAAGRAGEEESTGSHATDAVHASHQRKLAPRSRAHHAARALRVAGSWAGAKP
jgi:hypothetical protein